MDNLFIQNSLIFSFEIMLWYICLYIYLDYETMSFIKSKIACEIPSKIHNYINYRTYMINSQAQIKHIFVQRFINDTLFTTYVPTSN